MLLPNSHFAPSLDHVCGERLFVFERITGDNLLDGDVGSCQEPHNSNQADDDVLERRKRRQALRVKRYNLEERGKDQCQEAAAE